MPSNVTTDAMFRTERFAVVDKKVRLLKTSILNRRRDAGVKGCPPDTSGGMRVIKKYGDANHGSKLQVTNCKSMLDRKMAARVSHKVNLETTEADSSLYSVL